MRRIVFCIACLACSTIGAQKHQIKVASGLNKLISFDASPLYGRGGTWDNRIDATVGFSYSFYAESRFYPKLFMGFFRLRYLNDHIINGVDEPDHVLLDNFLIAQLGGGYKFDLSPKYELSIDITGGVLYKFRVKGWQKGQAKDPVIRRNEWSEYNRHFGSSLDISNYYRIFKRRDVSLFLVASVRGLYVFDFDPLAKDGENADRLIPEINLGIAFRFGDNRERF